MSDHNTTLTTDLLVQELNKVTNWQLLGLCLGLDMAEIDEIERDHPNTSRKRMEMFEKWMRKQINPSWEMVVEALKKTPELRLADQLRVKYCTQQHQDEKQLTSKSEEQGDSQVNKAERVLKVDRKDMVSQEIESFKVNYFELVTSTEDALQNLGLPARKIKRFTQFYMKAEVDNVEKLFDQMKPFYFLDYDLLEKIVEVLLKQEQSVICELNQYIQRLDDFKSSTTVQQFMESIKAAQKPLTTMDSCTKTTVVVQLVGGWSQKTIVDLDKLYILKKLLQDKTSVLSRFRISPGSVIITYLTPLSEVDDLIKIAQEQVPFMLQVGVCKLMIGDTVFTNTQSDTSDFSFESSLIKAVKDNNIDVLSPDAADDKECAALVWGSNLAREKAVILLLKLNANPNLQTDIGLTALYAASSSGHSDVVSTLLEANADPNIQTDSGVTPLHIASSNGHSDVVSMLLKANADPNLQTDTGVTPLHAASISGHSDIVSMLLKANANFLQDDDRKRDCLSAYDESQEFVKWIREEIKGNFKHVYDAHACMHAYTLCRYSSVCMTVDVCLCMHYFTCSTQ